MTDGVRLVGGRYHLLEQLGSGGMGTVWRAADSRLGREVAVKEVTFPPGLSQADREVLTERTRREARAAARLDHPNAVTVYDVVEQDGAPYLVMELVPSRTLADVVRTAGPLPPHEVARTGLALLGALEAAHARGIVHRDVKPSNVLVRDDGSVVLTDFGIATTTGDASLTSTGLLVGSPAYISPERANGAVPGPPADLWSLGATLFTAVEGRPPYDEQGALATVLAVVNAPHAPYALAGPLVPVLDGLLAKDPAQRLDAPAARRLLQAVADRAPARPVPVTPDPPSEVLAPAPVPDPGRRAAATSALDLGALRQELVRVRPRPPVAPARAPGRGRAALAGVAALAVVGAGTAYALTQGDDTTGASGASSAPATTAPGTPATTAPATTAPATTPAATTPPPTTPATTPPPTTPATTPPAAGTVPAGWSTDRGAAGWTVALPPGYAQTGAAEYRQAATGRTLRIETGPGQPDAVADRERAARSFAARHPTYRQLRLEAVDYRGYPAADWEFTYEGLHVLDRVFVVDGTGHSLYLQYRAADTGAATDFAGIAAAFRPVGAAG